MTDINALLTEHHDKLTELEKILGYQFNDRRLLLRAMTSANMGYTDEEGARFDYEALEFLGDRLINVLVIDYQFNVADSPTRMHSHFKHNFENKWLTQLAHSIKLERYIISCTHISDKMLADAIEALLAAIYWDCNRQMPIVEKVWARLQEFKTLRQKAMKKPLKELYEFFKLTSPGFLIQRPQLGEVILTLNVPEFNFTCKEHGSNEGHVKGVLINKLKHVLSDAWYMYQLDNYLSKQVTE